MAVGNRGLSFHNVPGTLVIIACLIDWLGLIDWLSRFKSDRIGSTQLGSIKPSSAPNSSLTVGD